MVALLDQIKRVQLKLPFFNSQQQQIRKRKTKNEKIATCRLLASAASLEQISVEVVEDHAFALLEAGQVEVDHLVDTIVDGVVELLRLVTRKYEHESLDFWQIN